MNALDAALCEAIRGEARVAGMQGKVFGRVVFKNPSAVAFDTHTIRLEASVGKKWRAMQHYPVGPKTSPQEIINRFAKDFFVFYDDAMAA